MCGIVGLHLTDATLYPRLGELLTPMLGCMTTRGPDSAGVALYGEPSSTGMYRYSVRSHVPVDWDRVASRLSAEVSAPVVAEQRADAAVLLTNVEAAELVACLGSVAPDVTVVGYGREMEVYKDVGAPAEICERYAIPQCTGYQGVGHTRMATESAVTPEHSHPFTPAADLSVVHNGAFSNYASVRRRLESEGVVFDTDNDTEVAARYLALQTSQGTGLDDALRMVLKDLDGFFTLLVATASEFAVMRDSFACKPLVIAEADGYVAVASEYHALAGLPDIGRARVFEPTPEEVYVWSQ